MSIFSILALMITFNVNAAEFTVPQVPKNLHIYNEGGYTYVVLQAQGCSGFTYVLSPEHKKYDAIFSILLAAQMANKKVLVTLDDSLKYPAGRYCVLQYITII